MTTHSSLPFSAMLPAEAPHEQSTSLIELPALARAAGVGRVLVKCENERMLGNFKVLGGMTAGLRALARAAGVESLDDLTPDDPRRRELPRLICASDGNHGLAVAAAARQAGAGAIVYLAKGVSLERAMRITNQGAALRWVDGTYDDAVSAAEDDARRGEGLLIADTSPHANDPVVRDVMAGYGTITRELVDQLAERQAQPTHVFVQAGVGGLAAAVAEGLHPLMTPPYGVLTVEPDAADCVAQALRRGRPVKIPGSLRTCAEMLSCGLASAPALAVLLRHKARPVVVSEGELLSAVKMLQAAGGPATTATGAAGLAGLLRVAGSATQRQAHRLNRESCVLLIVTEGAGTAAG